MIIEEGGEWGWSTVRPAFGMQAVYEDAVVALILALTLCFSFAGEGAAFGGYSKYLSASPWGLRVTYINMDGVKTIGKNTTGGFITGSAAGLATAGAAAAGIVTAPASPLAYGVPVASGVIGGFIKGASDAMWDGNLRIAPW